MSSNRIWKLAIQQHQSKSTATATKSANQLTFIAFNFISVTCYCCAALTLPLIVVCQFVSNITLTTTAATGFLVTNAWHAIDVEIALVKSKCKN